MVIQRNPSQPRNQLLHLFSLGLMGCCMDRLDFRNDSIVISNSGRIFNNYIGWHRPMDTTRNERYWTMLNRLCDYPGIGFYFLM
jgi:hypothetical protein